MSTEPPDLDAIRERRSDRPVTRSTSETRSARTVDLSQVSAYVWTDPAGEQRWLRPDEVDIVIAGHRIDAASALRLLTDAVGPCMDRLDGFGGAVALCELPHGHAGGHREGSMTWTPRTWAVPDELRGDGPCGDCGTLDNIVWFTESVLWNAVMRPPGSAGEPLLCILCFVKRVDAAGFYPTGWRLLPDWHWETKDERTQRLTGATPEPSVPVGIPHSAADGPESTHPDTGSQPRPNGAPVAPRHPGTANPGETP